MQCDTHHTSLALCFHRFCPSIVLACRTLLAHCFELVLCLFKPFLKIWHTCPSTIDLCLDFVVLGLSLFQPSLTLKAFVTQMIIVLLQLFVFLLTLGEFLMGPFFQLRALLRLVLCICKLLFQGAHTILRISERC